MKKAFVLALSCAALAQTGIGADIIAVTWPTGVYKINSTNGTGTYVGTPAFTSLNSLAKDLAGKFYTVDGSSNLIVINPTDGSGTVVATLNFAGASVDVPSMAFSPSGTLYVINRGDVDSLYTVNVSTGVGTLVGSTGSGRILQDLAFAPNGTLYAWDIFQGLFTVNTATGAATDVNPSEGATANIQSLAFSPDGTLYGAQYGLFTIDTATGVPSSISTSGLSDVRGMEFDMGPALTLSIATHASAVTVCWNTATNKTYQLQHRLDLGATNDWADLGAAIPGNGSQVCVTNSMDAIHSFYRVTATTP